MAEGKASEQRSLVCIDVGSVNTRAHFFDAVENGYRFLASGEARSTVGAPVSDMQVGLMAALEQLEELTGRTLLSDQGVMVSANNTPGVGINTLAAVVSGLPPLKVLTIGLLEGVSLDSVNSVVGSTYCEIVGSFSLNDRQRPEEMIDTVCRALPDLVVIAGGTDRGASRSVTRLASTLALAVESLPEDQRPDLLYAGNESLYEEIDNLLGNLTRLHQAPNIRPSLDQENLGPATQALLDLFYEIQMRKLPGFAELNDLAAGRLMAGSNGFGRVVRFLSTVIDPPKGMLGVDLGASSITVAAAFSGELDLKVFTDIGMGHGLTRILEETHLEQITRWLPIDIRDDDVLDYLYNKTLHPATLPVSQEELAIEQAAARQALRAAIGRSLPGLPNSAIYPLSGTVPWFDRILLSGSVLTRAPRPEQSLLMALDAIQPVGIATIILDQNNLASSLGLIAEINPLMAIQVLESNSFLNLGTVICPVGRVRKGSAVLRLLMMREGEKGPVIEVKEGQLLTIPLPVGRAADVYLEPMQNADIGLGPGRGGWVRRVVGGVFGLVVDARSRPIQIPAAPTLRIEALQTWEHALAEA
jgi:hypothetical protein